MSQISILNHYCLKEIFLYFKVKERMPFRGVCKAWRDAVDDTWDEPTKLVIEQIYNWERRDTIPRDEQSLTVHDTTIIIKTRGSLRLIEKVLERFGDTIVDLVDKRKIPKTDEKENNSLLPIIIKYCPNIGKCGTYLTTKFDKRNLERFFAKKKLQSFILQVGFHSVSFDQICTDELQRIDFTMYEQLRSYRSILAAQKRLLRRCTSSLQRLKFTVWDEELLEIIGEKKSLQKLSLIADNFIASRQFPRPILQLTMLRELILMPGFDCYHRVRPSRDMDDFLTALAKNAPQLEVIDIDALQVTARGIRALASLKNLRKMGFYRCREIANELIRFSGISELYLEYCNEKDEHIIKLLETAENIRLLALGVSKITNHTLEAAVQITKKRTNGIILTLDLINCKHIYPELLTETSPFLTIVNEHFASSP